MAYRVETKRVGERVVYSLHDEATGASASVLPSFGFNLFDLRLPVGDRVQPVLFAPPDWAEHPRRAGGTGIPVLFPFPNRVRGARFTFEGKTYELPRNSGAHAIHGFAIEAPWDVVEHRADADAAVLIGRYQISKNTPAMSRSWPTDGILEIRYRLAGRRLTLEATVTNPTGENFPFGFGIHPYFRMPFDPQGDPARTEVILPASEFWVLRDYLPTGERKPVDDRLDFRRGKPRAGLVLDDVLTGLAFEDGWCTCRLVDLDRKAELRLSFDRGFRELVTFTPPGEPGVISLEPYTQATDAIHLNAQGIDAGLRILPHGAHQTLVIRIETAG